MAVTMETASKARTVPGVLLIVFMRSSMGRLRANGNREIGDSHGGAALLVGFALVR